VTPEDRTLAEALRLEHALDEPLVPFDSGSVPVFAAGKRHVIKLFPAAERSHFEAEVAALTLLDGALSIPTPNVVAHGERDGRWFVVMSRLAGRPLGEVWPELTPVERLDIVRQVGAGLAELHATSDSGLSALSVDWPEFLAGRRAGNSERQAAKGLGDPWLGQVDAYLDRWFPDDDGRRALLHTEVMRDHLLVDRRGGGWRVSGLFDFEPAMIGAPEYEFASVGLFVTCAEPGLFGAALEAYGARTGDEELPYRIMAYTLLHRYSNLAWYLERLPSDGCRTLEDLARRWFST
jgi:hygromycin-B 7''-O-kinase